MNKIYSLMILSLVLVSMLSIVSADLVCESTIVGGTIYQDVIENPTAGANVEIICNHSGVLSTKTTTSLGAGQYSIVFPCEQCIFGDEVIVNAQKDALSGTNEGEIDMSYNLPCGVKLDVGIVNVPLVPEFGVVVGFLTMISAIGVFFVIRKK